MWTKRQLIEKAFSELALAGYVYDLHPEQLEDALQAMDAMVAEWTGTGINLGYLLPVTPDESDIDSDSGIPDAMNRAVYMNLAVTLAAGKGKVLSLDTKAAAARGYHQILAAAAREIARNSPQWSTLPRGAGNKPWRGLGPFFHGPREELATTAGDNIIVT